MEGKGEKVAPECSNRATPPPIALHTLQRTTVAAACRWSQLPCYIRQDILMQMEESSGDWVFEKYY
jgi:hypothetical protein